MSDPLAALRRVNVSSLTAAHAHGRPDAPAVRFAGETLTWSALDERASRLAAWLRVQGVGRGDRVAVLMLNRPEFLETIVAVARVGAIVVPLNFRLSPGELQFIIDDCAPVVAVSEAALAANLDPRLPQLIVDDAGPAGYEAALAVADPRQVLDDVADDATALIMYTSGTTGRPKGAMLSHLNQFVNAVTTIRAFHLFGDDVVMVATPLFHIAAFGALMPMFITGGVIVIHPVGAFDAGALLDVLEREQVTSLFLVPAQWQAVVVDPSLPARRLALRNTSWGAAPASSALLAAMADAFPDALNVAVFGQTEMSPVTCVLRGEDARRKLGSVGRPVGYVQTRVIDGTGHDVPAGTVGEIVYRGPTMMSGYWNRPQETAEAFADGWFHSGDLVRVDDEGFVYVVDRLKDMIISGGENIYCAEVEDALAGHPAVLEAAVVGRASERWGEEPVAFVVPRPGETVPELSELRAWLADRLAAYKHPRALVAVDELPRNPSGKVQKFLLRERLATS